MHYGKTAFGIYLARNYLNYEPHVKKNVGIHVRTAALLNLAPHGKTACGICHGMRCPGCKPNDEPHVETHVSTAIS